MNETMTGQDNSARVTADEVRRVAELANLELTADELPAIERDLNAILGYIAQLNELDTTGVVPMAQVGELLAATASSTRADRQPCGDSAVSDADGRKLRADRIQPSLDRGAVLAVAPESDGAFFKVPKVIER